MITPRFSNSREEGERTMARTALIIGATGLVGRHLLESLLQSESYKKIVSLTRRPLDIEAEKLEQHIIDFERLDHYHDLFNVDTVFCALGTTMKKAKTKKQFVKVDFDYSFQVAKLAKQKDVRQFFIVTAMGANQHSPFFYNRVKGNIEAAIRDLNFPILYIIRPSLLIGDRNEQRLGEDIGQALSKALPILFKGPLNKYKPNRAVDVAKASYNYSLKGELGTFIVDSRLIEANK